jgi:Zn-finger nucleic acid-binding protein
LNKLIEEKRYKAIKAYPTSGKHCKRIKDWKAAQEERWKHERRRKTSKSR